MRIIVTYIWVLLLVSSHQTYISYFFVWTRRGWWWFFIFFQVMYANRPFPWFQTCGNVVFLFAFPNWTITFVVIGFFAFKACKLFFFFLLIPFLWVIRFYELYYVLALVFYTISPHIFIVAPSRQSYLSVFLRVTWVLFVFLYFDLGSEGLYGDDIFIFFTPILVFIISFILLKSLQFMLMFNELTK